MCRDLEETRRDQSKPGNGQTQGKHAEKQTTRRGRNIIKSRVIKPRVYPKQSSFAPSLHIQSISVCLKYHSSLHNISIKRIK